MGATDHTAKIAAAAGAQTAPSPLRVLIVEDQAWVAGLISAMVRSLGHEPLPACIDADAVRAHLGGSAIVADVALLDQQLGTAHASAVVATLADAGIPTVMMTGFACEAPAGTPALRKPFGDSALRAAIRAAIEDALTPGADPARGARPLAITPHAAAR